MNCIKRIFALFLCGSLLLAMVGCVREPAPTTEGTTSPTTTVAPTAPSPAEVYDEARKAVLDADALNLRMDMTSTTTIAKDSYQERTIQTLVYNNIGSENLQVSVSDTTTVHNTNITSTEVFSDGVVYLDGGDYGKFTSPMTAEEFLKRRPAHMLLDAGLYGTVTSEPTSGGNTLFSFFDPSAGESWIIPEDAELLSASGTAMITSSGELWKLTYTADYIHGAAQNHIELSVYFDPLEEMEIGSQVPADTAEYVEVEWIDAPLLMVQATARLQTITSVTYSDVQTIISQAAGLYYVDQTEFSAYGSGKDVLMDLSQNVIFTDYSTGESSESEQKELFRDGVYTVSYNGEEPETDPAVTSAVVERYVSSMAGYLLFDPSFLASAKGSAIGGTYVIEFTGNEEMAQNLKSSVCTFLFDDASTLDDLASSYETSSFAGYFGMDMYTGLPTGVGYIYSGVHTIDGEAYTLSLEENRSYFCASPYSYEAITDEPIPETPPEDTATPLFYHVTGSSGEEMWILGTIHVGDERTGFLPQEIYDAFDSADSLAVEFDMIEHETKMEQIPAYATGIMSTYMYINGTTTEDHLEDPELYRDALLLLKSSGNYFSNMTYMKPSVWSSSIDNFILQQGYELVSTKGVDQRLLDRAYDMDKEVLSMESALFQSKLLNGFSDELQELMLAGSVYSDAQSQRNSTKELYELWCAGNEASLTKYLAEEDTSEMTEEELELYNEYNSAMLIDRNKGMVETALEYLSSGKKVFIAVGLAHVIGETGLVAGLQNAGYTVEVVTYEG